MTQSMDNQGTNISQSAITATDPFQDADEWAIRWHMAYTLFLEIAARETRVNPVTENAAKPFELCDENFDIPERPC